MREQKGREVKIQVGKYILRSDLYAMWIDKEYEQKNGKTETRRVAGYARTVELLLENFCEKRFRDNDAESMKELLKVLKQTYKDMVALNDKAVKEDFRMIQKAGKKE